MVAPSKIFNRPLNCYHCSQLILHPGVGCFRNFLNALLIHSVAGSKYFSPLLITPLVLKYKSMSRELLMHTVKHYLHTVFGASLATAAVFSCICCLRNLLGEFHSYTTLFLPTVLGLQFCWFFPTRVMTLFTTATSQAVLEGLLRQYSNKFTHLILHSPLVQTILFMLNSAIILHYKSKNIYNNFWFIQPHGQLIETTSNGDQEILSNVETKRAEKYYKKCKTICDHTNVSCRKFLLDGMKSYILYGIPLDLLAMLTGGMSNLTQETQSSIQKVIGKFKTFRPYMTCFFVSYVGIYRLSSCLLRKYYNHLSLDLQHVLSAFLGGLSFMFVKRVNFVMLSLVLSTQLLWWQFCSNIKNTTSDKKPNLVLIMLRNVPLSQIILSLNCGYLVHNYIFNNHLVNSLAKGFLDGLTHDKPKTMLNNLINNDLQSLIEIAEGYSVKTFF